MRHQQVESATLLSAHTTATAGTAKWLYGKKHTFQAKGTTSSGSGAATIIVEVSNADTPTEADWITMGTITLTLGTTSTSDGFNKDAPWKWVRARVSAISGTGAAVSAWVAG